MTAPMTNRPSAAHPIAASTPGAVAAEEVGQQWGDHDEEQCSGEGSYECQHGGRSGVRLACPAL
jgi:hypothetical protein